MNTSNERCPAAHFLIDHTPHGEAMYTEALLRFLPEGTRTAKLLMELLGGTEEQRRALALDVNEVIVRSENDWQTYKEKTEKDASTIQNPDEAAMFHFTRVGLPASGREVRQQKGVDVEIAFMDASEEHPAFPGLRLQDLKTAEMYHLAGQSLIQKFDPQGVELCVLGDEMKIQVLQAFRDIITQRGHGIRIRNEIMEHDAVQAYEGLAREGSFLAVISGAAHADISCETRLSIQQVFAWMPALPEEMRRAIHPQRNSDSMINEKAMKVAQGGSLTDGEIQEVFMEFWLSNDLVHLQRCAAALLPMEYRTPTFASLLVSDIIRQMDTQTKDQLVSACFQAPPVTDASRKLRVYMHFMNVLRTWLYQKYGSISKNEDIPQFLEGIVHAVYARQ